MKGICLLLVAALSAVAACAETRPKFGGTLVVGMRGSFSYENKSSLNADDELFRDAVLTNVCDRLVVLDDAGDPRSALAVSWRSEREQRSWYLTLRKNVDTPNGTLGAQAIATPLALANPDWRVRPEGDELLIQSEKPLPNLLSELAEPRNSVCLTAEDGRWIGSGPFQIADFRAGQYIELKAFDQAWQGRPFLNFIRFNMHSSGAAGGTSPTLRADLWQNEVPETVNSGVTQTSDALDLLALVFAPNRGAGADLRLRKAISLALDRSSIFSVLLRRTGEPGASLLPEWISGYAHLFDQSQNLLEAKRLESLAPVQTVSIAYDSSDPLAKLIAERVAVNAAEARIHMQVVAQPASQLGNADVSLQRVRIASPHPAAALQALAGLLRMPRLQAAENLTSAESLYALESEALQDYTVIPLAHVPERVSASTRTHDWRMNRWGEINWADVWTEPQP
ncbi:MAG: hypothetical protein JOZ10_16530 [Acidobacteria bacterium]|nr:hypothetical protein [Acidobacteriota bacterium]